MPRTQLVLNKHLIMGRMVKIKHCFRESTIFLCDVLYFIYIRFRYFKRYILKDKVVVYERTKESYSFYIRLNISLSSMPALYKTKICLNYLFTDHVKVNSN